MTRFPDNSRSSLLWVGIEDSHVFLPYFRNSARLQRHQWRSRISIERNGTALCLGAMTVKRQGKNEPPKQICGIFLHGSFRRILKRKTSSKDTGGQGFFGSLPRCLKLCLAPEYSKKWTRSSNYRDPAWTTGLFCSSSISLRETPAVQKHPKNPLIQLIY